MRILKRVLEFRRQWNGRTDTVRKHMNALRSKTDVKYKANHVG